MPNFDILQEFFPNSAWFNAVVAVYQKHLSSSLIGFINGIFLSYQENLYMIQYVSDLFFGIGNSINEHN